MIVTKPEGQTKLDLKVTVDQIKSVYRDVARSWVLGFSGGKDSTALLQIVFQALEELPRQQLTKQVHVVSNDTLVEIPQVSKMVTNVLGKIEKMARQIQLPITVTQTTPELNNSFFVNVIGRGYARKVGRLSLVLFREH